MTLSGLARLLDDQERCDETCRQLVRHYKQRFSAIIGILFADRRYSDIDKEGLFYEGLASFIRKELASADKEGDLDTWMLETARKKAIEARHTANRMLVKSLTEKGGVENWLNAFSLIPVEYAAVFDNVVRSCFTDGKYVDRHDEITPILAALFNQYRVQSGAKGPQEIASFENWLYVSLRHFANNKRYRQMIDDELGIGHHDTALPGGQRPAGPDDALPEDTDDGICQESGPPCLAEEAPFPIVMETDHTGQDSRMRLSRYLSLMPHRKYARLIKMLMLEGRSREEVVLELGIPEAQLYNNVNRAMVQLVTVALPDIQRHCRKQFRLYADTLRDEGQRELLAAFFNGSSVDQLALGHRMTRAAMAKKLASLYRELLKNIRRDPLQYSQDDEKDDF